METLEWIRTSCLAAKTDDPIALFLELVQSETIRMHGPEHHILDGACLLAAVHHAGVPFDLSAALEEMIVRGKKMPGATCGQWGMCGSASSVGAAMSILHATGPLSADAAYKNNMRCVSRALASIAEIGGPRCCKRNAFLSLTAAIGILDENYGIKLGRQPVHCSFSQRNAQCIRKRCPYCAES